MKNKTIASLLWLLLAIICIAILATLAVVNAQAQTTVALSPAPRLPFPLANGGINSLGCVFTYAAGTTTPLATYTDGTGTTANSNPILLDAAGMPTASSAPSGIWLGPQKYKIAVFSAGGTNCALGSQQYVTDNVYGPNLPLSSVSFTPGVFSCAGGNYLIGFDNISGRFKWCNNGTADTLVGQASPDTLTNKTLTAPILNAATGSIKTMNNIVFVSQYASLSAAETACTATPCLVVVDANTTLASNDSPASTVEYWFTGGILTINTGVIWTLSGNTIIAPENQQIIALSGTGSVVGMKWSRPEWFGASATIRTAVGSLNQTNGGTVLLRQATYRSGFEDNTQCACGTNSLGVNNVTIQGAGRPLPNSTTPTAFTAGTGTIIQGTFNIQADHVTLRDLGVDVGSTFVNANYTSQPDNGIAMAANLGHGQWQYPTLIRIGVVGYSASAAFHSILMENFTEGIFEDVWERYGTHGMAIKGTFVKLDGFDGGGNGSDCLILKADTSIALGAVNVGKVLCTALTAGDTGGVRITAGTASVGGPINIGQIITSNTFFGLLADQSSNSLNVTYLNVDSLQMDAAGVGANTYACFQVSTALLYANIGKIKCTNTGYVVEGNTGTFSNPDFINIGDIVGVNQHTAAISIAEGGTWKFGTTNLGGTQAAPVIAANNSAKLIWCTNCLTVAGWTGSLAGAAGGATIDFGILLNTQFGATCTTAASAGASCISTYTLPAGAWANYATAGMPDGSYVPVCVANGGASGSGFIALNATQTATTVQVVVVAIQASATQMAHVNCTFKE